MTDRNQGRSGNSAKSELLKFSVDILNSDQPVVKNEHNLTYKVGQNDQKLLKTILRKHGLTEIHIDSPYFSLIWLGSQVLVSILQDFTPFQKINHFPRTTELTRKDKLVRNIQRTQQTSALARKKYDFLPQTYLIPGEFQDFERAFRREKGIWIVKPAALSRGRGIFLINHPNQVPIGESVIVSKYIMNPLLVDGFKFDLRLYVAVTSFDPLVIYFYDEGLARFATVKYNKDKQKIQDLCMHLTNYSINRLSDQYIRCEDPNIDNYGNKWSLSALLRTLASQGHDVKKLIAQIEDIVIKTIISAEVPIAQASRTFIPYRGNCFELYGFDVLIDEDLKPWLIEVNMSPSLACDAPIDLKIKSNLIVDLLNLVGIACQDPIVAKKEQRLKMAQSSKYISRPIPKFKSNSGSKPCSMNKLSNDEIRLIQSIEDESSRRGGFIRIFPCEDTWQLYHHFLEDKSKLNHLIHKQLFGTSSIHNCRSAHSLPQSTLKNSKSLSNIADADLNTSSVCATPPTLTKNENNSEKSISCISLDVDDQPTVLQNCKEQILTAMEHKNLSKHQARRAFSEYLKKVNDRFIEYSVKFDLDQTMQAQVSDQLDLMLKFMSKALNNMTFKFKCPKIKPSLSFKEKVCETSCALKKFIQSYIRETKIQHDLQVTSSNADEHVDDILFDTFISSALEEDLEEVLALSTKMNNSTSAFLGAISLAKIFSMPSLISAEKPKKKQFLSQK